MGNMQHQPQASKQGSKVDRILILDFGSQVAQLIARRIREAGVYCELHPNDVDEQFIRDYDPKGIILSGSHASALDEGTLKADPYVFKHGVPVLGICYGMQTMAAQLGGGVENGKVREFGYAEVRAHGHSKLLEGIQVLAKKMEQQLATGQEPDEATAQAYEQAVRDLETSSAGQAYVVARANFEKVMSKVNQQISEGMEKGSQSSIITLG